MMLAMLDRVNRTSPSNPLLPVQLAQSHIPISYRDELVANSRSTPILKRIESFMIKFSKWIQRSPFFKGILNFFSKIFRFIKLDILFLFNDEEEDLYDSYHSDINEFYNHYFDFVGANTEAGRNSIRKSYYNLPSGLQKLIKEQLFTILKADRSDLSNQQIMVRRDQVLRDPFMIFDVGNQGRQMEGNTIHDARLEPMARAIQATISKL